MKKCFVLDTNVLLHNAESIESFADNIVILPMPVIEELDKFKKHNNELGRNARQVIRRIDALRSKGNLRDGVPIGTEGGMLRILSETHVPDDSGLRSDSPDNRILRLAYRLFKSGERVVFISKDINARLKADAIGIDAEDFEKQKINLDELYSGYTEASVSGTLIDVLSEQRQIDAEGIGQYPNQFVLLKDSANEKHTMLSRVVKPGHLRALCPEYEHVWNIRSRNREQRMALELLMDPAVLVVTLVGQAGTGKTLLALAAGLHCVIRNSEYDQILVSRPVIPMGKDIGYLPGDKDEKISHWMYPIFDNLTYLLRDGSEPTAEGKKKKSKPSPQDKTKELMREHVIELEALTYIRGRSIPGQYVIVDEAQNLTPHEVKTIVSRAGEGTKMVLTGDPYQIDNPYLDSSSNGLTYAAERLKEEFVHGHVTLRTSERSNLAAIAAALL